jgi:hypothetical protein
VWAFDDVPAAAKAVAECLNYQMFAQKKYVASAMK